MIPGTKYTAVHDYSAVCALPSRFHVSVASKGGVSEMEGQDIGTPGYPTPYGGAL